MRWVTYHWHIANGISDLTIHKDKETATSFFKHEYRRYFELSGRTKVELPMSYGYGHRKFVGVSIASFKKKYGKSAEAAIKRAEEK